MRHTLLAVAVTTLLLAVPASAAAQGGSGAPDFRDRLDLLNRLEARFWLDGEPTVSAYRRHVRRRPVP